MISPIDEIEDYIHLRQGRKGWHVGICPFCQEESLNIIFSEEGGFFHCWRKYKCGKKGNLQQLLHYLKEGTEIVFTPPTAKKEVKKDTKDEVLAAFIPVTYHPYLQNRHYKDFTAFPVGFKGIDISRLYFLIYQDEKYKGWVSRALKKSKQKYVNSPDTEFGALLYGYDQLRGGEPAYLVEGIFDFHSLRRVEKNVVATFGARVTKEQIALLKEKGVREVVLCFDPDVLSTSISIAHILDLHFDNVNLLPIKEGDVGDRTENQLKALISKLNGINDLFFVEV